MQLEAMRRLAGRSVSGLGFGGYRISSVVREHRAALIAALDHGASVVDTSPNYADGGSETLIGSILAGRRECRPVVVTKVRRCRRPRAGWQPLARCREDIGLSVGVPGA